MAGRSRVDTREYGEEFSHAVVVGGSIAGLLAARVLVDHFDRVTILDRDKFPTEPGFRTGVPQSRHVHLLLPQGRLLLEQLFPGLSTEFAEEGAERVQWPRDVLWLTTAGWAKRFEHSQDLYFLSLSREAIEWHIRRRVFALDRIDVRESRNVTGLVPSSDRTRVVGVLHDQRGTAPRQSPETDELRGDLVVDASGRNSRAPRWLVEIGFEAPAETSINAYLGYSSRLYRRQPERDWKVQFLQPSPPANVRGGVVVPIERNRWIVTLAGTGEHVPPTDDDGYLEFARSLRVSTLYDAIRDAEPLSPVYGYRRTENQIRHYDRLSRFPEGFIVMGDAACAFNPIYGQGMSIAAIEAQTLSQTLKRHRQTTTNGDLTGLARRFQREVAARTADAWLLATSDDLRYPDTVGARPGISTRLMHRYLDRVIEAATDDPEVNEAVTRVFGMLDRPTSLFKPRIVTRSLLRTRSARHERRPAPPR
jgi:2-polyprenyl-6-methoxyphenol hydroxylase-like FAD-dependent oxidoreductase